MPYPLPISWDSETARIRPGLLAPPMVCVSWVDMESWDALGPGVVPHYEGVELLAEWLESGRHFLGVNVAYDFGVLAAEEPCLLPLIFEAYAQDRVRDLSIDQKLIDIAAGRFQHLNRKKGAYSLAGIAKRHGIDIDKEDSPRLTYGRLRGLPISAYTEAEIEYAMLDAVHPATIHHRHREIEAKWATTHDPTKPLLANGPARARYAFALHLASCWGVHTSKERCKALERDLDQTIADAGDLLRAAGLVRPNGTKDTKAAKARMEYVCNAQGLPLRLTEKAATSLDQEACEATGDRLLEAYTTFARAGTLRTRVQNLSMGSGPAPLQPSYGVLQDTGRTSSYKGALTHGEQIQNMPTLPGARETLEPRQGNVFFGADYGAAQLHTLAQTLLDWFGRSTLADTINAGKDVYVDFASALYDMTYEQIVAHPDKKKLRQSAKPGPLGIPGGMGGATFQAYARGYGVKLTLDEAKHQIRVFKRKYPDVAEYLRIIGQAVQSGPGLVCLPRSNRWRGGMTYSSMANGFFQSPEGDGALEALSEGQRRCYTVPSSALYGARIWGFIHDEILGECLIAQAPYAAQALSTVMEEYFNRYTPDVLTVADPVVFWRWSKGTEPVYHEGLLVPSDPENLPAYLKA